MLVSSLISNLAFFLSSQPFFLFYHFLNLQNFTVLYMKHTVNIAITPDLLVTGWLLKNGPPNTKVNFSCNKRLKFATKFGVLGFLGIANLQKKFGDSISKIVDFFIMSNFC